MAAASKTRIEHDLLGDRAVPADAYYGVQTARALENFQITGVPIHLYPNCRIARPQSQKARVLLRLALTRTSDPKVIQRYFDEY